MRRLSALSALAAALLGLGSDRALAEGVSSASDANLITALDLSDSIMRHEEWVEFAGVAYALEHEAFLAALAAGRHGRIGFSVFVWSSDAGHHLIVPWTSIASQRDAARVADLMRTARNLYRFGHRMGAEDSGTEGRRTDISAAIGFATRLAGTAPFETHRTMINICGNGEDNVGQHPDDARDRALARGFVINGPVVSEKDRIVDYYRKHVQGGPGSFVLAVDEPREMAATMLEKFLRDLIAARQPPPALAHGQSYGKGGRSRPRRSLRISYRSGRRRPW
jgi:hypothetical protein